MAMSKGQIEAEISKAIVEFEKEYMGRGLTRPGRISWTIWLLYASSAF